MLPTDHSGGTCFIALSHLGSHRVPLVLCSKAGHSQSPTPYLFCRVMHAFRMALRPCLVLTGTHKYHDVFSLTLNNSDLLAGKNYMRNGSNMLVHARIKSLPNSESGSLTALVCFDLIVGSPHNLCVCGKREQLATPSRLCGEHSQIMCQRFPVPLLTGPLD